MSRIARPLGRGRGEGGTLGKRNFIYDTRLELGAEADWARFCPVGKRNRKEEDEEKEQEEVLRWWRMCRRSFSSDRQSRKGQP